MRREPLIMDQEDYSDNPHLEERPSEELLMNYNAACSSLLEADDLFLTCSSVAVWFKSESLNAYLVIAEREERLVIHRGKDVYTVWVYKDQPHLMTSAWIMKGNRMEPNQDSFYFPQPN